MAEFRRITAARSWPFVAVLAVLIGSGAGIAAAATSASDPQPFLITPTALAFGYVPIGSTSGSQTITIKNVSGVPQNMSGTGGGAGVFGGVQNCEGITLAAGASCQMYYAFSPTASGSVNGSTNGTWNGQSFSLKFTGTGIPQFLITPTSLDFGSVKVGKTSNQQVIHIKNLSNRPVVMSGSGGGAGVFGGVQNCEGITLAAGHSCEMYYAFTPTATGTVTGSTSGAWNGQSFSLKFKGTGTS
jgi:hypothetical protein